MRKTTAESTESQQAIAATARTTEKSKNADRNWRPLIFMGVILLLAAIVRVAFSFGISAGSDFALSGGTQSSNNLRFIDSIVSDGKIRFTDNWLNYPNGSMIVVPVVFDFIMAIFAMLFNVFLNDGTTATSLALALSGPVFGVLACIPMYLLGREMFSSRLAGYLAALYLALCPVFVEESVFSNGAGTSFVVFTLLYGILFLVKALKALNEPVAAYKSALIAGAFIAVASLSWIGFRGIAVPLVVVMVAQVLIDRFKGKDPRPAATVHSLAVAIGIFIPAMVYTVIGYWDQVSSGVLIFTALAICFVQAYAWTAKKPWALMLPLYAVVFFAILGAIAIAAPGLFDCIFNGNSIYGAEYARTLGREFLSLSKLAMYYGVVTYWFVFLVCLYMVYRFLANASSALYVFTLVWLFTMTLTCGHNAAEAAIAAPVFALGFAALSKAVLGYVNLGEYFSGIRTGAGKVRVRRILNPIPLMTVLVAVLLVAAPNLVQVIDAGVSSNDASDYNDAVSSVTNDDVFGSLDYYVKTTDSWTVPGALEAVRGGDGAFVTWMSYSDDVKIHADMKSFTDTYGNGADIASNILLANGVNGSSAAALLITSIIKLGMNDSTRARLASSGFSEEDVALIENVLKDADYVVDGVSVRDKVMTDYETYGSVSESISDRNIQYLFLTDYIAVNYHSYDITRAYDALGLRAPYIMVTGDMMPFFYGYSSIFDEMALLNGYDVDYTNGTVGKFTTFGYYAYYYGVYNFTDAMYDTLLYRTYIGMTPEEAGYSSLYDYIMALSSADETVQMHPGYGLSNYEVVYWEVKYNADSNAKSDDSGWEIMDAQEAIAKQKTEGGLINYLSGIPMIIKYVPNSEGDIVSGYVVDSSNHGVKDVRVSAIDSDGVIRGMTHTSENGSFKLLVKDVANTTLVYHAGAGYSSKGGIILGVQSALNPNLTGVSTTDVVNLTVPGISGPLPAPGYTVTLTNDSTKDVLTDTFVDVPYGVYKVSVKKGETEVATGTISVNGSSNYEVTLATYQYKVTVKDIYNVPVVGKTVTIDGDFGPFTSPVTDSDGVATFNKIPKGTYTVTVDGYYLDKTTLNISSDSSRSLTVRPAAEYTITAPSGCTVFVSGDAFSTSFISNGTDSVWLPRSAISDTAYTFYAFKGGKICSVATTGVTVNLSSPGEDMMTVKGVLKNSDGTAVSGKITFFDGTTGIEKYTYTAASDGSYTAYLPSVAMKVYATDSDDAFFGEIGEGATTYDINMVDADKISSSTLSCSSVRYSDVMVKVAVGESVMQIASNAGAISFYLPTGVGATIDILLNAAGTAVYGTPGQKSISDEGRTGDESVLLSLTMAEKELTVNNDLGIDGETKLSIGGTQKTVAEWATEKFKVRDHYSKSVTLGESGSKLYYSGSHYFDPLTIGTSINLSELLNGVTAAEIEEITYNLVTITGLTSEVSSEYTVKVYYDGRVVATVTNDSPTRIGTETTGDYLLHILKKDNTKVLYRQAAVGDINANIDECADAVEVSGYIGTSIDTDDMIFKYGAVDVPVPVEDGRYSVILKKNETYAAILDATVDKVAYVINDPVTVGDAACVRNFAAGATPVAVPITPTFVKDGSINTVTFTIPASTIRNTTENGEKFTFATGTGWQSVSFTMLSIVRDGVYVDAGDAAPAIEFKGYYNSDIYDIGSEELKVSIDGTTDGYAIRFAGYSGDDGNIYVNKVADVVGDYSYSYTYEILNTGSIIEDVPVSITSTPGAEWIMYYGVTDYIGTTITGSLTSIKAAPGTTTLSVSFMKAADSNAEIPGLSISFSNVDYTTTPDEIAIASGTATSDAESETATVSATSMSASGRDVINDKGSMPIIVWVMIALSVLILILIFWMASKRGVFARRK